MYDDGRAGRGMRYTFTWAQGKFFAMAEKLYDARDVSLLEEEGLVTFTCRLPWHTVFNFWHHQAASHCLYHSFKDQLPLGVALVVRTTVWPVSWNLIKAYCDCLSYEEVEDAS